MKRTLLLAAMAMIALTAGVTITLDAAKLPQEAGGDVTEPAYAYLLREVNGRIGIYPAGSDTPEDYLSIPFESLPEADRKQLATGVYAATREELERLKEDYDS